MGRRSGLGTFIKVVKAVDRANKRAIREAEKRRRQREREDARRIREEEKRRRLHEKQIKAELKEVAASEKAAFKQKIDDAKSAYEKRCLERKMVREQFVNKELK